MDTLKTEALAVAISFDADSLRVKLIDDRQLVVPLFRFPRLAKASSGERENYLISGGGRGLHWDDLDEDLLVSELLTSS